jgi:hypothetical protein
LDLQGLFNGVVDSLVQSTALEQDLFDMDGVHLPPYLWSGLVINFACKACSIWVVDIYHHIWAVEGLFNVVGGHLPP